jgi:hypothetical protein
MAQEKAQTKEIESVCVTEMKAAASNMNSAHNTGKVLLATGPVEHCKCMPCNIYRYSQTYKFLVKLWKFHLTYPSIQMLQRNELLRLHCKLE